MTYLNYTYHLDDEEVPMANALLLDEASHSRGALECLCTLV